MRQFLQRLRVVVRTPNFALSERGAIGGFQQKKNGTVYIFGQVTDCSRENSLVGNKTRSLFCTVCFPHVGQSKSEC